MAYHQFLVQLSLYNEPHEIIPELDEKELGAIGLVTTQWSYLEHAIFYNTCFIADKAQAPVPKDATNLAFKKRLRAWRLSIEQLSPPDDKARLLRLHDRTANLEQKRHKVVHGLWTWDQKQPDNLTAFSFRPSVEFELKFDLKSLIKLAREIGQVNFELTYPGGKEQAFRELVEQASERPSLRRSFLRSAQSTEKLDLHPSPASPPKHKPPR